MLFTLIKGHFKPDVGDPDGDSVRFMADDNDLWSRLEGRYPKISKSGASIGTVQLRFEGIDSIEKQATQPLARDSRDNMLRLIGYSADNRTPRGYILSRMTDDQSGRPIAFVFAGETPDADGADVFLDSSRLDSSVNLIQMAEGHAYPLYYDTLFAELRNTFNTALTAAKSPPRGYWLVDATHTGIEIRTHDELDEIPPIWPKLWRRLAEFLGQPRPLSGFIPWLEAKNERIDIISLVEQRGLQDVVSVTGNVVRLTVPPEDIRVVGEAGARPA